MEEARSIGGAVGVALEQAAHIEGLRSAVAASLRSTATPKAGVGTRPRWGVLFVWTSAITASRAAARSGSLPEGDSSGVGSRGGLDCSKVRRGAGRAPCSARWQICCREAVDNSHPLHRIRRGRRAAWPKQMRHASASADVMLQMTIEAALRLHDLLR